jgi:DNA-binding SARP family transcriptional activator/WD40 repeat protein
VRVRVLGPASVDGAGGLPPRDRQVLAALVVEAGRVCPADRLAEALYGEAPPATWRKVVHGSVGRLRRLLGDHAIVTTGSGYRLELGDDEIDVRRFERLVGEAESLLVSGEHERAALSLRAAIELLMGEPLVDLDGWAPAMAVAARYRELARQAEEQLVRAELASGRHQVALTAASELVVREPLREQRWEALALALYRVGRQGEALRTIRRARQVLADELGLEPGPELVALERSILAQDPALTGPTAVAGWHSGGCPYRGLAAYGVGDGAWFFGRDREIAECLGIVDATGFVAIVGASGSGKSSLARAGVAPALRRDGRDVAVVVPGADPERTLAGVPKGSVLVVDQLEELFVTCDDDRARVRFAAAVARWSSAAPVVATLRADHLGAVAELSDLAARVQAGVYLLGAMGEPELRSAVEGPAIKAGLRLEPGLVDLLAHDVAGQPGALPLLSHALAETYERREGPVLTTAGYRAVGGVQGAVARAADEVIESLPPDGRRVARDLFLRLVTAPETSDPVRQRIPRAALGSDPTTEAVLDALVGSRLVIADQDTVEIAHEAVCRAWPRLRAWLDEDRDGHRLHRHLALASQEWEQSMRDASELYRGARLVTALDWAARGETDLNDSERAFLAASAAQRDTEERQARRRVRRLRTALLAVGLLLVVAVTAGLLALRSDHEARDQRDTARAAEQEAQDQRDTARVAEQEADDQRDTARVAEQEAQAQRDAARDAQQDAQLDSLVSQSVALRPSNRAVAALLAVEAHRRRPDAGAWSALLSTFTATPGFVGYQHVPADRFVTGALIPGSSRAVVALDGRDLALVDLVSGDVARFPAAARDTLAYSVVRVSDDGRFVAQLVDIDSPEPANVLDVYNVATRRLVLGPLTPPFFAADVAISADGSTLAVTGGPTGELAVYRVANGELLGTVPGVPRPEGLELARDTAAVDFGPDGLIYLGSMLGDIRVIDPRTTQVVRTYSAPLLSSHNQIVASRGDLLVTAGDEAAVAIDTSTGTTLWTIHRERGSNACSTIAVAPASGRLYCGNIYSTGARQNIGRVGKLEERDLATGLPTGVVIDSQQGTVGDVAITADEGELFVFSHNAPVISKWNLDGTGPVTTRVVRHRGSIAAAFDPTGTILLVTHYTSTSSLFVDERPGGVDDVYLWDPVADRMIDPLDGIFRANWAGPRGRLVALFTDGTAGFYDLATHSRVNGPGVQLLDSDLTTQATSSDGSRYYIGYLDGRIQTFDTATGEQLQPIIETHGVFGSISGTAEGQKVITTGFRDGAWSMTVYDATTGRALGTVPDLNAAQVGPDAILIAANVLGDITEYDLETLKPLDSFPGVRGLVNSSGLKFSADGTVLSARSFDRTVSVYDVATHTRIGDPIPLDVTSPQGGSSLRADGTALAIGGGSGNGLAIWDLDPAHLADAACSLAGRNLSRTEWDTYLGALGVYRRTCPAFEGKVGS